MLLVCYRCARWQSESNCHGGRETYVAADRHGNRPVCCSERSRRCVWCGIGMCCVCYIYVTDCNMWCVGPMLFFTTIRWLLRFVGSSSSSVVSFYAARQAETALAELRSMLQQVRCCVLYCVWMKCGVMFEHCVMTIHSDWLVSIVCVQARDAFKLLAEGFGSSETKTDVLMGWMLCCLSLSECCLCVYHVRAYAMFDCVLSTHM